MLERWKNGFSKDAIQFVFVPGLPPADQIPTNAGPQAPIFQYSSIPVFHLGLNPKLIYSAYNECNFVIVKMGKSPVFSVSPPDKPMNSNLIFPL